MRTYTPPKAWQKFLYWFASSLCRAYFKLFWRLEVEGTQNIPKTGGVLLASNHLSLADPPLVGVTVPRMIYYFAKQELFNVPFVGWFIRNVNAFPVKRFEHDIGAFKHAQHLLENGQALVLFPEGTRSRDGNLGKAKPGVAMLAFKARVPVVPVCIANSNRMKSFRKIRVHFGKPIAPPTVEKEKEHYQAFSDAVMAAVAELKIKMV